MPLSDDDKIELAGLVDNAMKASLGAVLDAVKACTDRMDQMDQTGRDAADLGKRIDALTKATEKDPVDVDAEPLAADGMTIVDAQIRADAVANLFGEKAPWPMAGETVSGYRRRVAKTFKRHSKEFAAVDLDTIKAKELWVAAENTIYADATTVGRAPPIVAAGRLHMRERKMDGHIVREFFGSPAVWMNQFAGHTQLRGEGKFLHENLGKN